MTPERFHELQWGPDPQTLTSDEVSDGWHWCPEMDGLLCKRGGESCFCTFAIENKDAPRELGDDDFKDLV